jgi:hypothetical protein
MADIEITEKYVAALLPKLGLTAEPFAAHEDELFESLFALLEAEAANEPATYKKASRALDDLVKRISGDTVPPAEVSAILKKVAKVREGIKKKRILAEAKEKLEAAEAEDGKTGTSTIMSKMDDAQQEAHVQKALQRAAAQKANQDEAGARETLRYLAYEVKGSVKYEKHGYAALDKMADAVGAKLATGGGVAPVSTKADDVSAKMASGGNDAPKLTKEMVGKMKWPAFFKAYGVTEAKAFQPTFDTLSKQLVKEGVASTKPLTTAKAAYGDMKAKKSVGKFKSHHHLLGALTDALMKNGGAVKVIDPEKAKELITS